MILATDITSLMWGGVPYGMLLPPYGPLICKVVRGGSCSPPGRSVSLEIGHQITIKSRRRLAPPFPPPAESVGQAQARPLSAAWVPPPPRDPSPWGRCYLDGAGTLLPQQVATHASVRPCGVRNAAKAATAWVSATTRDPPPSKPEPPRTSRRHNVLLSKEDASI